MAGPLLGESPGVGMSELDHNPKEKECIVTVEKLVRSGLRGGGGALTGTGQVRP